MEDKTLAEFLSAYSAGKRYFVHWDFEEHISVKGIDLSDIHFEDCFLFLDFRDTILINAQFISCNIKAADFRGADLTNAVFKQCCVESVMLNNAITTNIIFEENYCFGVTVDQDYFEQCLR